MVGDGNNGIVGPFETAQSQFIGGQVILLVLVIAAFSEVNKDFAKMLKTFAKLASAEADGSINYPLNAI